MTVKLVSQTQAGDRLLIGFEDTDVVATDVVALLKKNTFLYRNILFGKETSIKRTSIRKEDFFSEKKVLF